MPRSSRRLMSSPSPSSSRLPSPPSDLTSPPPTIPTSHPPPPCCSCHSRHEGSTRRTYLSCLNVNTGFHLPSCECAGLCPGGRCALEQCATSRLGALGDVATEGRAARQHRASSKRALSPLNSPHSPPRKRLTTPSLTVVRQSVLRQDDDVKVVNSSVPNELEDADADGRDMGEKYDGNSVPLPETPLPQPTPPHTPPRTPPTVATPTRSLVRSHSCPPSNLESAVCYAEIQEHEAAVRQLRRQSLHSPRRTATAAHTATAQPAQRRGRKRQASRSLSATLVVPDQPARPLQ